MPLAKPQDDELHRAKRRWNNNLNYKIMYGKFQAHLQNELNEIKEAGLYKQERLIEGPQQAAIQVKGSEVLNF